ncbi:MqnA/MqnD/SBP family protein [Helicobacter mesocricetorum]|uniref:MqnA/MqnD/SBP family protein n=1 Tax=Helicobacter mesocricetorum TaxID=87012 RepID=UPI000CF04082|nr:MqnA/MqnD/SBP family protein [Helicobacter mesocricetorum]
MRFGKIDYLNLLPFEVFMRSYPTPSNFRLFYQKKKSYPAKLNKEFLFCRIDAGFVSSITALYNKKNKRFLASSVGIVAKNKVLSVICINQEEGSDYQSATSNALLKVLKLKGRVLIGDRALVEVLKRKKAQQDFIDMAECWSNREHLPFVFGRLCIRRHYNFFIKIIQSFQKKSIKIPYYLLMQYSQKTGVNKKDILEYLKLISYKIDKKANYGLERFYRELRILRIKPPKRF